MRNGDAVTEAGGAEALAREEAVGDQGAAQPVKAFEQQAGFLESTLLAGGVNAHKHLSGRQDGRETIHGGSERGRLCTCSVKTPTPLIYFLVTCCPQASLPSTEALQTLDGQSEKRMKKPP